MGVADRDATFSRAVVAFVKSKGAKPTRMACYSPWENPVPARWSSSCSSKLLDNLVVFSLRHPVQLDTREYIAYHTRDGTRLSLAKDTRAGRPVPPRPSASAKVIGLPRGGGLHRRYDWREAA